MTTTDWAVDSAVPQTYPHETADFVALDERWSTHNYHPLPVVIAEAEGAWVTDVDGKRYLDLLAGYSALNFGHRHPALVAAAVAQLGKVTLTSRAFHHDQLGLFCQELAELTGTEMVLPMNSGAEAVESAIKVARKWAYQVKGVPDEHGADRRRRVQLPRPHHDHRVLLQRPGRQRRLRPVHPRLRRGEVRRRGGAGRRPSPSAPPPCWSSRSRARRACWCRRAGYLREVRRICDEHGVLFIADEIQSGLGRTGELLALDHEGVRADLYTLGKALGGGILPVSAVVGSRAVLGVLRPGEHGSTFGGNPLACAVGRAVIKLLATGEFQAAVRANSAPTCTAGWANWSAGASPRCAGAACGPVSTSPPGGPAGRSGSEALAARGVLCKETHDTTLRFAPPLVISESDLDPGIDAIANVVSA